MITAEVPAQCPACGGRLDKIREEWASTTDVAVKPEPRVTGFRVCAAAGNAASRPEEPRRAWRRIKRELPRIAWDQG